MAHPSGHVEDASVLQYLQRIASKACHKHLHPAMSRVDERHVMKLVRGKISTS